MFPLYARRWFPRVPLSCLLFNQKRLPVHVGHRVLRRARCTVVAVEELTKAPIVPLVSLDPLVSCCGRKAGGISPVLSVRPAADNDAPHPVLSLSLGTRAAMTARSSASPPPGAFKGGARVRCTWGAQTCLPFFLSWLSYRTASYQPLTQRAHHTTQRREPPSPTALRRATA